MNNKFPFLPTSLKFDPLPGPLRKIDFTFFFSRKERFPLDMFVIKRDGAKEEVDLSKVRRKLEEVSKKIYPLNKINIGQLVQLVEQGLYQGITTSDIDKYTSKKCIELAILEPEYGVLASRLLIDNHHRNTLSSFKDKMRILYRRHDKQGKTCPLISSVFYKFVEMHQTALERMIDYTRDYLLDVFGFLTLENQYINKVDGQFVERPQDLFMREAITVCMDPKNFKDPKVLDNIHLIYDLLSCHTYTYATPTLNNSGFRNQQLSSCYLLTITDSLEGINKGVDDAAQISKNGGGIGIDFSAIRPKGSLIRGTNGVSEGVTQFLKLYGQASRSWNQGGKRNGSFAIFLRDFHPDFMTFIGLKNPRLHESIGEKRLFYGAMLSDLFWKAVEQNLDWHFISPEESPGLHKMVGAQFEQEVARLVSEKKFHSKMPAREVMKEIMRNQFVSGVPYIINIDHVNAKNNLSHYSNVCSSNLCVVGSTEILTEQGHLPIQEIVEKNIHPQVWNGQGWKPAIFAKTGVNSNFLQIETSDGESLECTLYHKFYIQRGYGQKEIQVEAKDLQVGDNLIKVKYPILEMAGQWKYPYAHGFFCGDGIYDNPEHIEQPCQSPPLPLDLPDKFAVPEQTPIQTRLEWLAGYADADGTISRNGTNEALQITSNNKSFLQRVKRMCQTLGTNPMISLMTPERNAMLPDGKGGQKEYHCKACYRLLFNSYDTYTLYSLGMKTHRLRYSYYKPQRNASRFITIKSIQPFVKTQDTYCFHEPETNRGIFNGIIAGNCVEIMLPSSEHEYGVCNLCSIVLPTFVHQKGTSYGTLESYRQPRYLPEKITEPIFDFAGLAIVTEKITESMDRVIDRNSYPVPEAALSNFLHRPIGIGTSGLADVCCLMKTPYNSNSAVKLSGMIAETIAYSSLAASTKLAKKLATPRQEEKAKQMFTLFEERKKCMAKKFEISGLLRNLDNDSRVTRETLNELKSADLLLIEMLELSREIGPFPSYFYGKKAPISHGQFQWKMWGLKDENLSGLWDWGSLEEHIKKYGVRNSLLTAQMPTATTALVMGVNESVEPFTSNLYRRKVLTGEYEMINKYLVADLTELGMWNEQMKDYLLGGGSVQALNIPILLKELYRTAWEMPQKISVQHAVARAPFLDHSQSFNVWIPNNPIGNLDRGELLWRVLYEAWRKGLKTGIYYTRTEPAAEAAKFTVPLETLSKIEKTIIPLDRGVETVIEAPGEMGCLVCGT